MDLSLDMFESTSYTVTHFETLAEYIALLNAQYYLTSPWAISAPCQNQNFWMDMHAYEHCFNEADLQYKI